MIKTGTFGPIAALLLFGLISPAQADAGYFQRFNGSFAGSGTVQREQDSSPRRVSCSLKGATASANRLRMDGTCRAAIIVRRAIGADLRYDPSTDRFSGTYTGSSRGLAQLRNGRLRGDTLTLDLVYPQPVHGDRNAVMTIRNSGNGAFTLTVTDRVDGQTRTTSNVTLQKS
ncbi:hypothetical protein [Aureimonas ureilytica]|uniref:hypothetical protein n=1 Tax=Aureimonas ureilytica TaxID=401562 RepID=UPI000734022C|nr:hypothetical protein [Aureimonas ureilytica]